MSNRVDDAATTAVDENAERAYEWLSRVMGSGESEVDSENDASARVTLTFAQTLDGFIGFGEQNAQSVVPLQPLQLSGTEAFAVTHALRATHDGILVGVRTVARDNPSLTVRRVPYGPPPARSRPPSQPRPIVLDSHLHLSINASILTRNPIVLTIKHRPVSTPDNQLLVQDAATWKILEDAGATIVTVPADSNGRVSLPAALKILKQQYAIRSVMIEGGAGVIQECLSNPLVPIAHLIVTIAPFYLGHGVHATAGYIPASTTTNTSSLVSLKMPPLSNVTFTQFGKDMLLHATVQKTR